MERIIFNPKAPFDADFIKGDELIEIRFHKGPGRRITHFDKIVWDEKDKDELQILSIEDRLLTKFIMRIINSAAKDAELDTSYNDVTFKHQFCSYESGQFGHGLVSSQPLGLDVPEIPVFVHDNSDSEDPDVRRDVQLQTQLLARLLNNFRIDPAAVARLAEHHKTTEIVE